MKNERETLRKITSIKKTFMKYVFACCLSIALIGNLLAQNRSFKCDSYGYEETDMKSKPYTGQIEITSKNYVIVTSFLNGGENSLIFKIDSVIEKNFFAKGNCRWYYGKSTIPEADGSYRKNILIEPLDEKTIKKLYLFDFADEVTVFKYIFYYK
jgi:hypothetical protein